jgi:hypothetical protein
MVLYLIPAVGMIILGLVYLSHTSILPYHQKALYEPWEKLTPNLKVLLNTLVRAIGAGSLVSGLALVLIVLFPFRRGELWSIYAVPFLSFLYIFTVILIARNLAKKTPGGPSLKLNMVILMITLLALILSVIP